MHTPKSATRAIAAAFVLIAACAPARAQSTCGANPGPDLIVGDIFSSASYSVNNGNAAFYFGTLAANLGTHSIQWQAASNRHPVVVAHLYRLRSVDGSDRMEQIGLAWVHHHFTALADSIFCPCTGPGGSQLGVGCNDSDTANRAGTQLTTICGLGPRFDVNAHSGAFQFPYPFCNNNGSVPVTSTTRRLQARTADLALDMNPGANYFAECQLIAPDDAAARNQNNNCSHRKVSVIQSGANYQINLSGQPPTFRESPAIHAWQLLDPNVFETPIDTPELEVPPGSGNNSGRLILAARATHLTGPTWHYEYALFNMNSDRSVSGLSIPVPDSAAIANIAFHDVDYHSGDGFNSTPDNQINFDATDWPGQRTPTAVTWLMPAAQPIENSNALRWGTTFNFRFDADGPPARTIVTLDLFKPAPGLPDTVDAITLAPVLPCLLGDLNHDGQVTPADIQPFIETLLEALPADPCPADLN